MLVLTRKLNESIMIGEDIEIVIVDIKHNQIKVGVKAPRNVQVHRKEVFEEIQKENEEAAMRSNKDTIGKLSSMLKGIRKVKAPENKTPGVIRTNKPQPKDEE